jgi:drug/metabolite transporter (DMT)-like permease
MISWSQGKTYMLLSTLFYAMLNICVKQLHHLPALELIFFRSFISFFICAIGIWHARVFFFGHNHRWLFIRGVSGIMALWLYFTSLQHIPLASAVAIQYTSPIFTAIFATFLLKEKMNGWKWFFFLLSMAGIFMLKGFDSRISMQFTLIGITSAVFSGLAYNAIRKLRHTEHPLVIIIYFPMVALPITALYSYFHWIAPQGIEWILVLLMGLFTQAGQFCATKAIQMERLEQVTFLNYAGILFALILGFLLFDESFALESIVGMLLILSGIFLNLMEKKKSEPVKSEFAEIKNQMP